MEIRLGRSIDGSRRRGLDSVCALRLRCQPEPPLCPKPSQPTADTRIGAKRWPTQRQTEVTPMCSGIERDGYPRWRIGSSGGRRSLLARACPSPSPGPWLAYRKINVRAVPEERFSSYAVDSVANPARGVRRMGRRRDWTAEDDERIRELTAKGLCRHAIAVRLGCADSTVEKRARAIDVPLLIKETGRRLWKNDPGEPASAMDKNP